MAVRHSRSWGFRLGVAGVAWALLLGDGSRTAAQTRPADAVPEVSRDDLLALYRAELGPGFADARFDRTLAAHRLLERFFAAPDAVGREAAVQAIERSGVDAVTIGRLCRIRLHWTDLPPGAYYVNERIGPHEVRYFLGVPEGYARTRALPLVVRLAPADPFVGQQAGQDQQQVMQVYRGWVEEELRRHPEALLVMPLLNLNTLYGPSYGGTNTVIRPLLHVGERVNFDPARVYLVGHSLGGHAAWNLGLHYPTYFAAINPMGASARAEFQRLRLRNLRNTLPVVWHDANDELIKVDMARQIVRALRGLKIDVEYEETRRIGHRPPDNIAERLYAKTLGRQRPLYPKEVMIQSNRPDAIYNRVDWLQIDMPARPGDEKRMYFSLGREHFVVHANAWSARATMPRGNRFEITTENVELLRILVNDQMIDPSAAVAVVVNQRVRFEGPVRPDIRVLLADQLFLGRGWRYFTGAIEIDLAPPPVTRPAGRPASTKPN